MPQIGKFLGSQPHFAVPAVDHDNLDIDRLPVGDGDFDQGPTMQIVQNGEAGQGGQPIIHFHQGFGCLGNFNSHRDARLAGYVAYPAHKGIERGAPTGHDEFFPGQVVRRDRAGAAPVGTGQVMFGRSDHNHFIVEAGNRFNLGVNDRADYNPHLYHVIQQHFDNLG